MKKIILSLVFIVIFATGIAVAEITPTVVIVGVPIETPICPEQQAVKVVRGPAGSRGSQGARGPVGPAGQQGEIPWWPLALVAIGGGLLGGVIVAALNRPQQAPAQPQPVQQPISPVNIFNNVLPPGAGGQQPNQPQSGQPQ